MHNNIWIYYNENSSVSIVFIYANINLFVLYKTRLFMISFNNRIMNSQTLRERDKKKHYDIA